MSEELQDATFMPLENEGAEALVSDVLRCAIGTPPLREQDALAREEPLEIRVRGRSVAATILTDLPARLRDAQQTFARTGGLHAAAVFDSAGEMLILREDVGRHNAVDKVLGYGFLQTKFPFDTHVLLVSGRASFEIMQK